MSQMAF